MMKISVVMDELFSNIVKYSGSPDLTFFIFIHNNLLSIKFQYRGDSYDITKVPDPDVTKPLKERGEGGLGIYLVKKLCDNVTYEEHSTGNIITCDKNI